MNPIRSSLPSSRWLVATVVPWLTAVTGSPSRPLASRTLPTTVRNPPAGAGGARAPSQAQRVQDLADAGEDPLGGVGGRGRRLRRRRAAGLLVPGQDVGELPAGVDPDPDPACAHARKP